MDIASQFKVWPSIITTDAILAMSDIIGPKKIYLVW